MNGFAANRTQHRQLRVISTHQSSDLFFMDKSRKRVHYTTIQRWSCTHERRLDLISLHLGGFWLRHRRTVWAILKDFSPFAQQACESSSFHSSCSQSWRQQISTDAFVNISAKTQAQQNGYSDLLTCTPHKSVSTTRDPDQSH